MLETLTKRLQVPAVFADPATNDTPEQKLIYESKNITDRQLLVLWARFGLLKNLTYIRTSLEGKTPIELHSHSTYSDGSSTPVEMVARTQEIDGILAITDHNEYRGSEEACKLDESRIIPAIELNTSTGRASGIDVNVYAKDVEMIAKLHAEIKQYINPLQPWARLKIDFSEVLQIIDKLNQSGNELIAVIGGGYMNRYKMNPHVIEDNLEIIKQVCTGYENNTPFFSKLFASPEALKEFLRGLKDNHDLHLPEFFGSDAHHIDYLFSSTMALPSQKDKEILTIKRVTDAILNKELAPQQATRLGYPQHLRHIFLELVLNHIKKLTVLYCLKNISKSNNRLLRQAERLKIDPILFQQN